MCGRFTLRARLNDILAEFALEEALDYAQRYNIAPSQQIPVITAERKVKLVKWGQVPSWATDPKIGYKMINARAEGVADKPSFRSAFKRGRCLVITDGFYEWRKDGKAKQPFEHSGTIMAVPYEEFEDDSIVKAKSAEDARNQGK